MVEDAEQPTLSLPGLRAPRRRATKPPPERADIDSVARVVLDIGLAHLDRDFDYLVSRENDAFAQVGARIEARFAGKKVDGWVVGRRSASDHTGTLQWLARAPSAERVLAADVWSSIVDLARDYAGIRSDLIRLAVPPRHAREELRQPEPPASYAGVTPSIWSDVQHGPAFWQRASTGAQASWVVPPGVDWPLAMAELAGHVASQDRGVIWVLPDHRDVERAAIALRGLVGDGFAVLTTRHTAAERYRQFLRVSRGEVAIAIGTRSAAFAPVQRLGLAMIWDEGDDLHGELRAPYPHALRVLETRSRVSGAGLLVAGHARSVAAQALIETGQVKDLGATRSERVIVRITGSEERAGADPGGSTARFPRLAYDAVRDGLQHGPVLVVTPRSGYQPQLSCQQCRQPARCERCAGPLARRPDEVVRCAWCAHEPDWTCAECGGTRLRATVTGDARTAEELGRTFPSVRVRSSSGERVVATVSDRPAIVVATPGAEPVATGGYAAVVLLDAWAWPVGGRLGAEEEALRRAANAIGLARGGAHVVIAGESTPWLQALVRHDLGGFAAREWAARAEAKLPPALTFASLSGAAGSLDDARAVVRLPAGATTFGPLVEGEGERLLVAVRPAKRGALSAALLEMQGIVAARKMRGVRVQIDPLDL